MKIFVFLVLVCSSLLGGQMVWKAPTTLSSLGVDSSAARVAMDQNGNVTAAWIENGVLTSKSLPVNGSWGSANILSQPGASSPCLVVSPTGDATALWLEGSIVTTSFCPMNGRWSGASALSSDGASFPQLAVDTSGNLVAVWVRDGNVESATKLAGGSWSTVDVMESTQATSPYVSIGADGTVAVVWGGMDVNSINSVYSATKAIGGTWGSTQMLSTSGQNSGYARISVNAKGDVLACFFRWDPDGNSETNVVCQVVELQNGMWTSPQDLSDEGIRIPEDVRIGQDDHGNAIVLWSISYDFSTFHLQYATRLRGADWGMADELLGGNLAPCNLDTIQTPGGDFRITMLVFSDNTPLNIYSSSINLHSFFSDTWSPFDLLSTGKQNANPKVAATVSGSTVYATAVWVSYNGSNLIIQAASGTETLLPPLPSVTVAQNTVDYGVFTEYQNTLQWENPSDASNQTGYVIYREGVQVAQLYYPECEYIDYNQTPNQSITYGVAVIDFMMSQQSATTTAVLPSKTP